MKQMTEISQRRKTDWRLYCRLTPKLKL